MNPPKRVHMRHLLLPAALLACTCDTEKRMKLSDYCASNPASRVCSSYRADNATREFFAAVAGAWKTGCTKAGQSGFNDDEFTFKANLKYVRKRKVYVDDKCTQALYLITDQGGLHATHAKGAFGFQLDLVIESASILPLNAVGATALAEANACRKASWEANRVVDLIDCSYRYKEGQATEESFTVIGMEYFTGVLLKTAEKTLLFGDQAGNLYIPRVEDRPKTTRQDVPYLKQ
jgi:hypothetical protein